MVQEIRREMFKFLDVEIVRNRTYVDSSEENKLISTLLNVAD